MNWRNPRLLRVWAFGCVCGVAALSNGVAARADEPKSDSPKPEDVIRQMVDFLAKAKSFSVEAGREQKFGKISVKQTVMVDVEKPAKLAIRVKTAAPEVDIVDDGKTLSVAITPLKKYVQSKAPASLLKIGDDPMAQGLVMGSLQGSLLGELITADPYKNIMDGVKSCNYVGAEEINGTKVHHLKMVQDQFDWEIWIAAKADPLIVKIVTDLTKALGAQAKGQKAELVQEFKNWKINPTLDPKTFAFDPPAGFAKAKTLQEALGQPGSEDEEKSALIGKPALAIKLKTLEGDQFQLEDFRDKSIVMVDFWATWCGPCIQELPVLNEVAESYKSKGVALIAINLRETPAQIRKFQEDKKLKFPVALDSDAAVGKAYGVNGIPTLLLIDKKGIVQAVHVGFDPKLKATLTGELDALLAGKPIKEEKSDPEK